MSSIICFECTVRVDDVNLDEHLSSSWNCPWCWTKNYRISWE